MAISMKYKKLISREPGFLSSSSKKMTVPLSYEHSRTNFTSLFKLGHITCSLELVL